MERDIKIKKEWDSHWEALNEKRGLFNAIFGFYRKNIIANAVRHYFERYFPKKGIFVEMGSGTSQTSIKIIKHGRTIIALDISKIALDEAKKMPVIDKTVQGNIFKTKFKNRSVDGIWNLGVMEHFSEKEIMKILDEFHRVLKKGSYAILFWPPVYGVTEIIGGIIENLVNIFKKDKFHFFPGEVSRIRSKSHVKGIIDRSRLKFVGAYFNYRDAFTHVVVVCKKE